MVANASPAWPVALDVDPEGISAEMRACPQWVTHKDKVPYAIATGVKTDYTEKGNLGTFDDACRVAVERGHDGPGYSILAADPYVLVDFDHCVRPDGSIAPLVLFWVQRLGSYAEYSPGDGVHSVGRAGLPGEDNRFSMSDPTTGETFKVELYDRDRYFRMTGRTPEGLPTQIVDNQEAVDALYASLESQKPRRAKAGEEAPSDAAPSAPALADEEVLLRARNARNGAGAAFVALFDRGEIKDHGHDHSAADLALCCRLAFWTQDADQIDRLVRKSKLVRGKWDERRGRQTYGAMTVTKALELTTVHYSPPPEPKDEPTSEAPADDSESGQDDAHGRPWTGPRDWDRHGPVTQQEARAMSREQLEHYAITWSRMQFDVYHLLTNQARVVDDSGKERPALNPTDKVVTACAWFEANRAPGLAHPTGHPVVLVRRDSIARRAGVHANTVGKTLEHAAAAGLVIKERRANDDHYEDMYLGAPQTMLRNRDPLPVEAAHRSKDRRRKECRHCHASAFVHQTVCGGCGAILKERVEGEDESAVADLAAKVEEKAKQRKRAGGTAKTPEAVAHETGARPPGTDSVHIPYRGTESVHHKDDNHVGGTDSVPGGAGGEEQESAWF